MNKIPFVLLAATTVALTGCVSTFHEVKPQRAGAPPTTRPSVLVLGPLQITNARLSEPEQTVLIHAFQLGVEKWCAEHHAFEVCQSATNVVANAAVLSGTITEVEKGSAAARFWVGMGAGQARIQGEFELTAADGSELTAFKARKSYLGGSGIGGWDMMKFEELVTQFGQLVAETTDKWLRGEKIE
jgi:hypothetical protein